MGPASNERGLVEKEGRSTCPLSLPNHARRSYPAAIRSSPLTESLERATRFINIVIGATSDVEWFYRENRQKIGRVVTLEEKLNKILSSTIDL